MLRKGPARVLHPSHSDPYPTARGPGGPSPSLRDHRAVGHRRGPADARGHGDHAQPTPDAVDRARARAGDQIRLGGRSRGDHRRHRQHVTTDAPIPIPSRPTRGAPSWRNQQRRHRDARAVARRRAAHAGGFRAAPCRGRNDPTATTGPGPPPRRHRPSRGSAVAAARRPQDPRKNGAGATARGGSDGRLDRSPTVAATTSGSPRWASTGPSRGSPATARPPDNYVYRGAAAPTTCT